VAAHVRGRTLRDGGLPLKLSDDGRWWWNGQGWLPTYSLDGRSRFDGRRWVSARRVALPRWLLVASAFWAAALLTPGVYMGIAADDHASDATHLRGLLVALSTTAAFSVLWGGLVGLQRQKRLLFGSIGVGTALVMVGYVLAMVSPNNQAPGQDDAAGVGLFFSRLPSPWASASACCWD